MRFPPARFDHCLITGASAGLGAEFARQLAPRAKRLTLAARREDRLRDLAAELAAQHQIEAIVEVVDLGTLDGPARLLGALAAPGAPPVDLLVNNAGFGRHRAFEDDPWSVQQEMVLLNAVAMAHLVHGLWAGLSAAPGRGVINVVSTAAFQPIPFFAMYGATKAFMRSFSAGVGQEAREKGVRMLSLCPGPVPTEFGERAQTEWAIAKLKTAPEVVVRHGIRAYEAGRREAIPGLMNRLVAGVSQRLPLAVSVWGATCAARRH